ncbi:hypothetical protein K7432_011575 [Basidiobolus ranarum]|uniref:DNA-directed RNA polymerase n=1 Tax=Basidiobolus ranarum TaxID=34480 RepID=A0ABR2VTN6_9FUNG
MMGKRGNYSARAVISPDPNIETSEIGIPPVFASKLTYPEPVTHYNVKEMRRAVINGPDQWPGASHVQHEDGTLTSLGNLSLESRIALANQLLTPQETSTNTSAGGAFTPRITGVNKKVLRHLKNGDLLLLNRQPTLHKPSIMAHRARVLPGEKTIRMHYANCNTYNADFDGDEMNIHFPQNEIARAEALLIANTDSQYLVPTNGSPLRGLIQDHVVVGVWMTSKDTFFTREEYQQVIYGALRPEEDESGNGKIDTVPPSIWKPEPLWTGKQIISTILKNLTKGLPQANVKSKAKVPARYWGPGSEEQNVLVMDGELLCGVLDKSQFGASAFGLVHSVYELYGPSYAGKLLSIFGRLFTKYVQMRGFTCRMDDLRLTEEGDQWRRDLLQKGQFFGRDASRDYVGLKNLEDMSSEQVETEYKHRMEEVLRSNEKMAGLDAAMKSKMNGLTSSIINKCLPAGLLRVFPDNNMQMMTISGAKGSNVNVSQISCLLGQQELEGRRVPTMVSGKTLPSFLPFDSSARAGGFIAGRFLTGIRPQEYFFHCMAGREGLIDTAVKTANSGYLQRCLIKHLEGLRVHYDHTVRDSDGSILQFQYGEDALDVIKQKHLNEFSFIASNYAAFIKKQQPQKALAVLELEEASSYSKKALKKPSKYDPVLSKFNPSRNLGAVSEKFQTSLDNYLEQNSEKLIVTKENSNNPNVRFPDLNKKKFKALMHLKYLQSLADPGEAVGLLAAQGVGEPSTQMTLNTFHFAGFGAKNVTLGIPRLREIVMTASANIKTPSMTLPLHSRISDDEAHGFCQDISKLTLAAIMDDVVVKEQMTKLTHSGGRRVKAYKIRLNFFTKKEYRDEYNLEPSMVQHAIEKSFVSKLERAIVRDLKKVYRGSANAEEEEEIGKPLRTSRPKASQENEEVEVPAKAVHDDSDEEDEDSEVGDNDADDAKRASKRQEKATYDGPDEEDEAMIAEMNKELESDAESSESEPEELENHIEGQESAEHKARAGRIVDSSLYVKRYKFDEKNGSYCEIEMQFPADTKKILMVGIVEKICHETVIHEVKGIDRCFPFINEAENDTSKQLATDGVNLRGMWNYPETIDLNNIYTNDVAAILRTYGVEAARNAITKEIGGVFGVYGIEVDPRHLSLIADYMTFEGGYKPFNRMGIESNVSPFLKMSFETTCHFLTNATVHGDYDTMASPSARIVVGKVVEGGTGSFEIRQPLTVQ